MVGSNPYLSSQIFGTSCYNFESMFDFFKSMMKFKGVKPLDNFKANVFKIFQVDIDNIQQLKFVICKQLKQSWDEFDKLPFWEMEDMTNRLKTWIEKEKEEQEKADGKHGTTYDRDKMMRDSQKMQKQYAFNTSGNNSSGMPKMPNFNAPKGITPSSLKNFKI